MVLKIDDGLFPNKHGCCLVGLKTLLRLLFSTVQFAGPPDSARETMQLLNSKTDFITRSSVTRNSPEFWLVY